MARIPIEAGEPDANALLGAFSAGAEDLENLVQRVEIIRVNNTNYLARLYYVGDPEFDAVAETWD